MQGPTVFELVQFLHHFGKITCVYLQLIICIFLMCSLNRVNV